MLLPQFCGHWDQPGSRTLECENMVRAYVQLHFSSCKTHLLEVPACASHFFHTRGQWPMACGLNQACHLLLYSLRAKNRFYLLSRWKKDICVNILFWDMWKLYGVQIIVSTIKVLLKHSHSHSFICLWLHSCKVAELSYWDRDCMACKA